MAKTFDRTTFDDAREKPRADWRRWLHVGIALALLVAVVIVVQRQLEDMKLGDVVEQLRAMPRSALAMSITLTAASYAFLCAFDALGLRYIGKELSIRRVAFTSFLAYAISHNLGAGALTGGAVRYRLYSSVGLTGIEIATLQGFCSLTTVLGLMVLIAVALIRAPLSAASVLHVHMPWPTIIGEVLLLLIAAYLAWGHFGRRSYEFRGWALRPPGEMVAVMQVAVGVVEMGAKAAVLWSLLPGANVDLIAFMGAYGLAVLAGMVSYVPGGLGVFESVMLFSLPGVEKDVLLSALLAYRVIYYLIPMGVAGLAFAGRHIQKRLQRA